MEKKHNSMILENTRATNNKKYQDIYGKKTELYHDQYCITGPTGNLTYLAEVAKRFGSPGLNRREITVSVPHSKLFTG